MPLILASCRYWVDYETHLVEESLTETVDLSFLKTSVKNFSTNISEDVHFSLTPSQVTSSIPIGWFWNVFPRRIFQNSETE